MQLSWYASVSKNRENQKLRSFRSRKKHKRLEAICEKAYNRSHKGVEVELSDCNGRDGAGGDELELRRSTRVRKAPVVLDASPLPARKRRKIDFVERVKNESVCSTSRGLEGELVNWRSRLRSRARTVSSSPKGKKKLFEDLDGFKEKDKKGGWYGEMFTVVKSKRSGRIEALAMSRNGHEDQKGDNRVDMLEDKNDENDARGSEGEMKDTDAVTELEDEKVSEVPKECNDNVPCMEEDNQMEQPKCLNNRENQRDDEEVRGVPNDTTEDEGCHDQPLKNLKKVDKMSSALGNPLRKPRIKKGRRCDLCGRGTDGKPPKKLLQNGAETDNEAYSGSSASEEPTYDIWDGFGDGPGWLGNLLGPINDRHGIAGIWVHHHCAIWSPEVYFAGIGRLKNVRAALCRGRVLKCSRCGRRGATIGCRVDRCPKTYHLPCARVNGCIFDHHKFLVACTDHRRLFQPQGSKYFDWLKKMKARKMKLTMKKSSNDACRNDIEEEEKWLENCGEDEEFLKRESKRLHRDLLRIAPVYIGGSKSDSESQFQGWESVAGLQEVIQCLKEVVILPLLYPDFFSNLGLTPPRGVLLHGYPGTGKTLVVRALIGSCARGDKRIAYFARKGADCLGKYVGDAERQLRLLFQVAEKSQPSIIFFDEIDGLAPPRTRQQDQTHSSVVSTLLALMDGLKSRGSVVVIGATNRPDAVDPALRRPGRFDREIYFPLPSFKDREAILALHTQTWPKPVTGALLKWIARKTVGFAGADLQALCTQAAIAALKRSCPLQKLLSAAGEKAPHAKLPPLPSFVVEERDWLKALSCAPPPCSQREAGMAANDVVSSPLPAHLVSCLLQPLSSLLVSFYLDERVWLPTPLYKAAKLIETVIISALEKRKVRSDYWWFHVHDLLQEADVASEIETNLSRVSILVGDASFYTFDASDNDTDDDSLGFESSNAQHRVAHTSLARNINNESRNKSGLRILISGNPRTGQRHLASSILHCFVGNVEIQKVDLATIQQEGHGDEVQGVTQILKRCANVGSCMMFMPRINLWAMEACYRADKRASDCPSTNLESSEESQSCLTHCEDLDKENKSCPRMSESTDMGESKVADLRSSRLWNSFIEQVESICVSTSLMILATSEVSFTLLPPGIRQFFGSDILNCSPLTPLVDTVPRFSIEVDGSFERDVVINSSAAKLSKDLAQYFVQLIHHRNHVCVSSFKEDKVCDKSEGDADTVCHNLDPVSLVTRGSPPHNNKSLKGKTSLLLEISTFGYQILQYPHFAELCWVSSKLKEGPCADISGPWKGWPFNSCITRLNDSLEKTAVACSSSNINNTEKIGFVRGLMAVGLSAYRGVYTSLKEFTSEFQNVLKLLARYINAKIQSRRDRYQFTYLLSQVAYLDDMVNIWAYKLQSLEADAQATDSNPKPTWEGFLDEYNPCKDNVIRSDICRTDAPYKNSVALELLEESQRFDAKDTECVNLKGVDGDSGHPTDQLDVTLFNKKNGNHKEAGGDFGCLTRSNGFACSDSIIHFEDGPCDSSDLGGGVPSSEINMPSEDGTPNSIGNVNVKLSSNMSPSLRISAGVVCVYRCCSECIFNLHCLMKKVVLNQPKLKESNWTIEDLDDVVGSLSVNLHSTVRLAENSINLFDNNLEHVSDMGMCGCIKSVNRLVMPKECSCHSRSESGTVEAISYRNLRHGLDSVFTYRDGVLGVVDTERDASFHCKFETFCLCSLIEWIIMNKQPSD